MNSEPLCTFYIFLITHKGGSVHLEEKNATTMHCSGIDSFLKNIILTTFAYRCKDRLIQMRVPNKFLKIARKNYFPRDGYAKVTFIPLSDSKNLIYHFFF